MSHEVNTTAPAPPRSGSGQAGGSAGPVAWRIPTPRSPGRLETAGSQERTPVRTGLSQRDLVLLRHLGSGASTTQIAAALSVSRNTARTRIRRVGAKLAVPDRSRLALAARDLGLV